MKKVFAAKNEGELPTIAEYLKESFPNGGVFLLYGDLGFGKTALVRAFAALFDLQDEVSSPTFSIMNEYGDKICHYDFYNFGANSFFEKALFEYLEGNRWHFMEWADEKIENFLKSAKINFVRVNITKEGESRFYEVSPCIN